MRYLPLNDADRATMLERIGVENIDALFCDVPAEARLDGPVDLPIHKSEMQVERDMHAMASQNMPAGSAPFFCGAGAYRHHVPATVDHIIQRSEFLTSYTPYQPEITQGTLQYLFEFQSQVAELTGMEVANASMYDGSTAAGEAVLMAHRVTRRNHAVVSGRVHPQYVDVIANLSDMGGFGLTHVPPTIQGAEDLLSSVDENTACVVVQNPDFFGSVNDYTELAEAVHARGALLIVVVTESVSLGVLKTPGTMGADIVVGEGQSLGNGLNFGGPYVGLFAAREKFLRQMPGRLCGETVDADGKRGFVLTLSTREQHIRRDKATSNICTNSGLCSLAFTAHLSLLGGNGLQHLARLNHEQAVDLAGRLGAIDGVKPINETFFNEFTVELPQPADMVVEALAAHGVLGGVPVSRLIPDGGFENYLLVAATETCAPEDMAAYGAALKEVLS